MTQLTVDFLPKCLTNFDYPKKKLHDPTDTKMHCQFLFSFKKDKNNWDCPKKRGKYFNSVGSKDVQNTNCIEINHTGMAGSVLTAVRLACCSFDMIQFDFYHKDNWKVGQRLEYNQDLNFWLSIQSKTVGFYILMIVMVQLVFWLFQCLRSNQNLLKQVKRVFGFRCWRSKRFSRTILFSSQ